MSRLAAFAFSELAETSATLEHLGEGRSDRARRAYLETVRSAISTSGGRQLAAAGDGVLAIFDSASSAIAFAGCVQRGCERESRRSTERLDVRIGIDVGEATVDDSGPAAAKEVLPSGASIRSTQLARLADAGTVLATSVVAALATAAGVRFKPVGLVDLAGSPEPVAAVEVVWERPPAERTPMPSDLEAFASRPRFVGRGSERERLDAAWRQALEGNRQVAFIVGEPGIGKTRLAAEFACSQYNQGATVLWGRSFEEALIPYQPFVQALQHHVRWATADELRDEVGAGGAVLARLLPELKARVASPPGPVEDPESERYRLFEAIGRLLTAASADRPLLIVLDDLQWADQGTLLLLKHLARDTASAPLLLLGTYRHSEVGRDHPLALVQADIERDRIVERVELNGLAEDEVGALAGSLLGWDPPDAVIHGLRGETEGNPLFLEELLHHLAHVGLGPDSERLVHIQAAVQELGVPGRVRELVGRRVQRLSAPARATLSAAAVIGSEFGSDVLAQMTGAAPTAALVGSLDEAVEARLLVESSDRVGHYGFSHALIQQALYEDLTVNHRAALHAEAARAIEKLQPDGASHAELAYHYGRAGGRFATDVVVHGRKAGERALDLFAYEDAVRELSAALAAFDSNPAGAPRDRAELLALLGRAHTRAGSYESARAAYHTAAELSALDGAWPLLAQAVLGYGGGTGFGGIWTTFAAIDEELVRLLEIALAACPPGDSHERVRLLGRLSQALYWSPDAARAQELSEEAVAIARRLRDPAALAYALDSRHGVLWGPDHLDEERAVAEEMLELGRRLGDRDIQLEALAWLITDALESDPIEVVDRFIAEHARVANELRQPYHLWYTEATRAMRAHLDGRFAEGAELCEKAYTYGRQSHGDNALQTYLVQMMFLKLDLGQLEELIDSLQAYVAASPLAAWRAALALALAGLDRRDEALEQVGWFAGNGFANLRRDCVWMTSTAALGRTVGHFEDATYADDLYQLLLPFAGRNCVVGGAVLCLGPVSRILGMLARAAGNFDVALSHLDGALEQSRALGSRPLVARTELEAAKTHLRRGSAGDAAAARRLLDDAASISSELAMEKLLHDIESLRQTLPPQVQA